MELIQRFEISGEDSHIWQVPVSLLHKSVSSFFRPNHPPEIYQQTDEMLDLARIIISESIQRYHIRHLLKQDEMAERMGVLNARLIAATNEAQIFTTLVERLPEVGLKMHGLYSSNRRMMIPYQKAFYLEVKVPDQTM
jgi:hypothetical protein